MIHLSRIGRLGLLRELYAEVLVPNAVAAEVGRHVVHELDRGFVAGWLKRLTPADLGRVDQIERDVGGRGEAEVIAVALEAAARFGLQLLTPAEA